MKIATLALAFFALCGAQSVFADVNYTKRYLDPGQALSPHPETRVLFKPGARLEETWRYHSGNYLREKRLMLFGAKKEIVMDVLLKIYTVVPLEESVVSPDDSAIVKVKELDEETVFGMKARHFQIDIQYNFKDASPGSVREVRLEHWVVLPGSFKALPDNFVPINWGTGLSGDVAEFKQAQQGLVLRTRGSVLDKENPGQYREVYTEEISSLSTLELDDTYFEIPTGYKEVTPDEFSKAQMLLIEKWILKDMELAE